ncbi:LOW QUALITY PROTEIN: hypothetical protein BC938DRAFT_482696 [Jimgerdemannia flammicorona]|uniref:Uncharacterized protein n=1 Tax=Jimgerdemannia flammicorona TaxID=994334 RepID=A0A433QDD1_9FUNG|nr:LOW QUALITY PROTEIN: hypothetical protein BC938DRAFT_482696 [Jimgerdemannia flammicorona]
MTSQKGVRLANALRHQPVASIVDCQQEQHPIQTNPLQIVKPTLVPPTSLNWHDVADEHQSDAAAVDARDYASGNGYEEAGAQGTDDDAAEESGDSEDNYRTSAEDV